MPVKGEAQKNPLFWRFSGVFDFLRSACSLRIPQENPFNFIKSPTFTNSPGKSTCLYNAPSLRTLDTCLISTTAECARACVFFWRSIALRLEPPYTGVRGPLGPKIPKKSREGCFRASRSGVSKKCRKIPKGPEKEPERCQNQCSGTFSTLFDTLGQEAGKTFP